MCQTCKIMDAMDMGGPVRSLSNQEFRTGSSEIEHEDHMYGLSETDNNVNMEICHGNIIEIKPIEDNEDIKESIYNDMEIQDSVKNDENNLSVHNTISVSSGNAIESRFENHSSLNVTNSRNVEVELQKTSTQDSCLCTVCGKAYEGKGALVQHMRSHQRYACERCSKIFTSKRALDGHKRVHSEMHVKKLKCIMCGETCHGESGLENHMRQHPRCRMYIECGETSSKESKRTAHKNRVHKRTPPCYASNECKKVFEGKMPLAKRHEAHLRGSTRIKNPTYPCEQCGKVFSLYKQRLAHIMKDHRQHGRITCTLCGVVCRGNSGLSKHNMLHSLNGFRTYPCEECDEIFDKESRMRFHLRIVHGKNLSLSKRPACNICGKNFAKDYMATHMKTHSRDQKQSKEGLVMSLHHACEVCGKEFSHIRQLNSHRVTHIVGYCTVCGVQFPSSRTSNEHRNLNPGHTVILLTKETDPTVPTKIEDKAVVSDNMFSNHTDMADSSKQSDENDIGHEEADLHINKEGEEQPLVHQEASACHSEIL